MVFEILGYVCMKHMYTQKGCISFPVGFETQPGIT